MTVRFATRIATVVLPMTLTIGWPCADALRAQDATPLDASPAPTPTVETAVTPDQHDVECVAKVILHEAGNQSARGQRAVAQVIRTRMKARGAASACEVVREPGQFFAVDSYRPQRGSAAWTQAVEIATTTLRGEGEEVVPGALFFHAAYRPMHGHQQVARIEGHIFYR